MSRIMRRTLHRSVLAAGGTLLAAVVSRKYWGAGAEVPPDQTRPPVQGLDTVHAHPPRSLPSLSFTDADGRVLTLEQLRLAHGGGIVLNLWATWCVPCVAEMPALDTLSRVLAPSGIAVLTVSLDHGGADQVRAFQAAHQIRSLPVLLDPHSASLVALGLDGIPTTLLINRNGQEVARISGSVDWASPQAASLVTRLVS
jgi:thiol-disulfide isomerase/thioredoxin